ncbi:MAG: exo-alpha-sialidase [Chloroflexota bacterium]
MSQYPSGTNLLLTGTKRGLFILSSPDRKNWTVDQLTLAGENIYNAMIDNRGGGRMFAAQNDTFFGSVLKYSDDLGETWQEPKRGIQFPEESGRKLVNIWIIQPGRDSEPETIYCGVDPASLWVSHDSGETWDLEQGLESHPTRESWNPGNGGLCLHSIVPDYSNPDRMWIGISAVGCMRTDDGGKTWTHANKNTRQDFGPEKFPEYGQCLHRLIQHPNNPDTLYQQNHCGVYKSHNGGDDWTDIRGSLPSDFGFPIAIDPNNPETIFTILEDGMGRFNFADGFKIYRSKDAGETWDTLTNGLPAGTNVRLGVLRHGMCNDTHDPVGVYAGTNTGQIFASTDQGDSWDMIADYLPSVYSVTTAVVP